MASLFGFQIPDLAGLLIMVFGGALLVIAARYIAAYLNAPESADDDRFKWATNRTSRWLGMIVGGVLAAAGVGIVEGVDIVAQISMFVGAHPFAVSNLGAIGLGAGALSGALSLTTDQYVGIAMVLVFGSYLASEVYGDAA
jgi:hypothetical protein